MTVKLRTEHHLECLSLKGGCPGSSGSTLVKMSHCWKSHVQARMHNHSVALSVVFSNLFWVHCLSLHTLHMEAMFWCLFCDIVLISSFVVI